MEAYYHIIMNLNNIFYLFCYLNYEMGLRIYFYIIFLWINFDVAHEKRALMIKNDVFVTILVQ